MKISANITSNHSAKKDTFYRSNQSANQEVKSFVKVHPILRYHYKDAVNIPEHLRKLHYKIYHRILGVNSPMGEDSSFTMGQKF